LVAGGRTQIRLLNRKGEQWTECVQGDGYIVDQRITKGHTAAITSARFHPFLKGRRRLVEFV
jgi:hypothetical protein